MSLSGAYDRWHQRVFDACPEHPDESSPWYKLVLEYLVPVEGKRVLEVACGRGGFSRLLAARGASVCGADFSLAALEIAQRRIRGNGLTLARLALAQADSQRLPFADNSFDVIISCETIEHVPDPPAALKEMARVCRTGGLLYLTTPNYLNLMGLYEIYAGLFKRKPRSEFAQPLDRHLLFLQVRRFFRPSGWEILHSDGTVHQVPVPGRDPVTWHKLESSQLFRRWLSPLALHYFLIGRKRGPG